ncbi:MAG TPA: hypothetical protein VFQ45_20900, partial [Longimicrobium sp.]|nr:hypothetical protein [Longimicrobium sp.]
EMRFGGMTREVWECLRQRARAMKVPLPDADAGTIVHPDAAAKYAWSEADGTLRVTITRKPVWLPCEAVEYRLRDAIEDCGGG